MGQQGECRLARHAVSLGLGDRRINDVGGALQRGAEERLVGLELLPGIGGAAGCRDGKDGEHGDDAVAHAALAAALALGAAEDVVGGDAEQPGDDLGEREGLAVALLARVGREQLDRLVRDLAVGIELEFERRREAFELGIAGLAADDQRDDRPLGMPRLEEPDLLVDVVALGGSWRADDDQRGRRIERGERLLARACGPR